MIDSGPQCRLTADHVTVAYDQGPVLDDLTIAIPDGKLTAIVGPNACGKSTLLRTLARELRPVEGVVLLDGRHIHRLPTRDVAGRLGMLPAESEAADALTVLDLVRRGRCPDSSWLRSWGPDDDAAIADSMAVTGVETLAHRKVDELSGGDRQRAWVAVALAQATPILLLDEPTAHLDIAHQIEILDLLSELVHQQNRTVAVVLHDLNHACNYADHIVVMKDGRIVAEGTPAEVIEPCLVRDVFSLDAEVLHDPVGTPLVVPHGRHSRHPVGSTLELAVVS